MNTKQKLCILVGAVIIAAMGLFPPWTIDGPYDIQFDRGYSWMWVPPHKVFFKKENAAQAPPPQTRKPNHFDHLIPAPGSAIGMCPARLDIRRLCVQWVVVVVLASAGVAVFSGKTRARLPDQRRPLITPRPNESES